jgi:hypothetical protein
MGLGLKVALRLSILVGIGVLTGLIEAADQT